MTGDADFVDYDCIAYYEDRISSVGIEHTFYWAWGRWDDGSGQLATWTGGGYTFAKAMRDLERLIGRTTEKRPRLRKLHYTSRNALRGTADELLGPASLSTYSPVVTH